jgi:hypothetical protein
MILDHIKIQNYNLGLITLMEDYQPIKFFKKFGDV